MNSEELKETEHGDLPGKIKAEDTADIDTADIDEADIGTAEKNLVEMDENEAQEQAVEADLDEQIRNNIIRNVTLADAEIKMFGDRTVLAQVAQLVAYIRHAVKSNEPTEIKVSICKSDSTVFGAEFMFDLNGYQVPDLVPQQEIFIN